MNKGAGILIDNMRNAINEKGFFSFFRVVGIDYGLIRPSKKLGLMYWNISKKKSNTNNNFFIKTIHGNEIVLHYDDQGLSRELFIKGKREQLATNKMREILQTGDVVYDIGANIGYFVLIESKIIDKEGHIYAIEPVPFNAQLLRQNIKNNKRNNVTVFEQAIGSSNMNSRIYLSPEMNKCTMSKLNKSDDFVEVKVQTLDTFAKDKVKPTILRMDVEGYEYEILRGAKEVLNNSEIRYVFLELHPSAMEDEDVESLLMMMKNNGFFIDAMFRSDKELFSSDIRFHRFATYYDYESMTIERLLKNKLYKKVGCPQIFFKKM